MKRWTVIVSTGLLAGALGLAGCGAADSAGSAAVQGAQETAVEVSEALDAEGMALVAMGYDEGTVATGSVTAEGADASDGTDGAAPEGATTPDPKASDGQKRGRPHRARVLLRKNTLHGDVVVQGKDGNKTVTVQRGTVVSIDGTSVTVKSSDGFTQTWTFAEKLRVVQLKKGKVEVGTVKAGAEIGVAGHRAGDKATARLIVLPKAG
jgi:hypothetical protein